MSGLDIMEALGGIHERYVFEAKNHSRKRSSFGKWALIAACFVCVLLVGVLHLKNPATDPVDASPAAMAPGLEEFGNNHAAVEEKLRRAENADAVSAEEMRAFTAFLVRETSLFNAFAGDGFEWRFATENGTELRIYDEADELVERIYFYDGQVCAWGNMTRFGDISSDGSALMESDRTDARLRIPGGLSVAVSEGVNNGIILDETEEPIQVEHAVFSLYDTNKSPDSLIMAIECYDKTELEGIMKNELEWGENYYEMNHRVLGQNDESVFCLFFLKPISGENDAGIASYRLAAESCIQIVEDFVAYNDIEPIEDTIPWRQWYEDHVMADLDELLEAEPEPPERLTGPDPETVTIAVEQQMLDNLPVEEIARRFEAEYPNTRVELISILTDNTAYGDADLVDQVGIWERALSENPGIDIVMSNGTITSLLGGKGLLADLEQELDLSDLLPNLRDALKGDGGVYILPNYLSVMTYYGKTQWLGDVDTLYAEDLLELAQNPDVPLYAVSMESASLLISDMASKFMNPAEGKVNFDNEEFRTMLELAQYLYHDPRYANPLDNDIRNDTVQLNICQVFTLQELYEIEHYFVDADIAFCGLYGAKNGYFELFNTFALTKNGAEPDMNSEFLQFCLRDEMQALWGRMGIPVTMSALENQFAMFETNSVFYATGEDSYTVHADEDVVYQYQPMTIAQFGDYRDWLLGVDTVDYGDARLHNVITQEISKFLSGEQPLDETVAVIQEQAELAFGIIFE